MYPTQLCAAFRHLITPSRRRLPFCHHREENQSRSPYIIKTSVGCVPKPTIFFARTSSCDCDVIVLTETWLNSDVNNAELSSNYNIYRCDRSSATSHFQRGGGALIAVKKSVQLDRSDVLEQVVVKKSLANKSIFVCGIYLRPNSDPGKFVAHSDCVEQILDKAAFGDSVVIVGDYNLPRLIWYHDDDFNSFLPSNASTEQELTFAEHMMTTGLQQICNVCNVNARMLDLAFVRNCSEVELIEVPSPILSCDRHHKPFVLRLTTHSNSDSFDGTSDIHDLDFDWCNYDAVMEELHLTNWDEALTGDNVNEAVDTFYSLLFEIISRHTPLPRHPPRHSNSRPW